MHDMPTLPKLVGAPAAWSGGVVTASLAVTFIAQVLKGDGTAGLRVVAGGRPLAAHRAPSCLLEPEPGDRVACWRAAGSGDCATEAEVYIVAILARRAGATARLSVDGDAELSASGRLRLSSQAVMELHAPELTADASSMKFGAGTLSLAAGAVQSVSGECRATFGELQVVGASCSTVFTSEHHHAQSHCRSVEGVDRLDAQVVDHEARELMNLRGKTVIANGSLVKLQGGQLHLG